MPLEGLHLGHYHLLRLLGSGGMGEVYLAEDARIGQQVAIKVIRAEGIAYPGSESAKDAARLFEREAKAIARLDHPHILPLYAYGEETLNDTQLTYLVMPYRKEGTLASWLRQRGGVAPLSPAEVAPLLQQAAAALQHAHNQHILHQDIKPSNFLIRVVEDHTDRPDLLLSDFGIAKLTSATASASQSIRGTPIYMAPEQWDGHPVVASDQYALAIMVYELLVGRPPFVGNPGQVMRQHYMTPPPAPSSLNASLSPAIDAVLLRALAKDPEERFPSVSAFARAFQEAVHSEGALQATLAISQAEAESGTTRTLTVPGGRQVSLSVPAGVSDGTTLRLEGQGMPYYEGGPSGPLVLTIAISGEMGPPLLPQDSTDPTVAMSVSNEELLSVEDPSVLLAHPVAPSELEPTVLASHESESASTVLATDTNSLPTEAATLALPESKKPLITTSTETTTTISNVATMPSNKTPFRPSSRRFSVRWMFLILLALLLIVGGGGAIYYYSATQNQANTTAYQNLTSTALANNYFTATANGIATSQANGYATATAQANATATATASPVTSQNPYGGTLALDDPLRDNSKGYAWDQVTGPCEFTGDALHVSVTPAVGPDFNVCVARNTNFNNLAFQVQMTVIKGDGGGILFRDSNSDNQFYYFHIGQDGSYDMWLWNNNLSPPTETLRNGTSSVIKTGLNQSNLITVVALGNTLALYVNNQLVDSVNDNTYKQGAIGVFVYDSGHPQSNVVSSEVKFSNAKVWRL